MAMIDYGAIAFKNGKLISTEFFTPMKDMVGWEDTEDDTYHNYETGKDEPLNLSDNYFAYIGDEDCTIAFYKNQMVIVKRLQDGTFSYGHEYFNCTNYTWSKWEDYAGENLGHFAKIKVTKRNGYLVCKWNYRGDKYKVYFGYGVDLGCYKKYHVVNAYRTPAFLAREAVRDIRYKLEELRWR